MKKALVVGGSSGIGLSAAKHLVRLGWHPVFLSRTPPPAGELPADSFSWESTDLLFFDEEQFVRLSRDTEIEFLLTAAGVGRVAAFEEHHIAEVHRMMEINANSLAKILWIFYSRMLDSRPFYTAVMGSIAGLLSSPLASPYAASKAAVSRLVESVNIELEARGTGNRILHIAPGFVKGTRFYGGENQPELTEALGAEIVRRTLAQEELWIPQYEEVYRDVLRRYHQDAHTFGMESFRYKEKSGRMNAGRPVRIGYLSGTFDLFHVGHLNLLRNARARCDYLIVGVHSSGAWKGKETFIPLEERKAILAACRYVDRVTDSCPEDSDAWLLHHYNRLFVGTDYKGSERFRRYEAYFRDKDVEIVYLPYTLSTSSTQIRRAILEKGLSDEN